ncbi:amidase [Mesorhizobium sp. M0663]|uniref:amidase n=1 Tax=Mesorhizobium sp. M0663 TaxID=2956981 RepID=UPI003335E09D
MTDLASYSATDLIRGFKVREFSPVEVLDAVLERIDRVNPILNAFVLVDPDRARTTARASEHRWARGEPIGLVDGIPASVKDQSLTEGWPTRKGSRTVNAEGPWTEDAPVVARLKEQGAVLVGKTTTPEYGWKAVTDSPLSGISRNPWDPTRTCGGSSGGAAIAAAAGMGALHQGSDGGGSIRIPAAFCGVFGLKPTFGRVPMYPQGYGSMAQLGHYGPITRTVADAALMMTVMARSDSRDWLALQAEKRTYLDGLDEGIAGLKIAYSPTLGYAKVDAEVAEVVAEAALHFEQLGAVVEEATPKIENPLHCFLTFYESGLASSLASLSEAELEMLDPGLREMAERGRRVTAGQLFSAWQERERLARTINEFYEHFDLLITPQVSVTAFETGTLHPPHLSSMWDWIPFAFPFNLTHQPAAAMPCGFASDGLPVSFQIVAPRHADRRVLRASRAYERVRPIVLPDVIKQSSARVEAEGRL